MASYKANFYKTSNQVSQS